MARARILVIEDSEADVALLQRILEREMGEHVFEVLPDGGAAMAFVRRHRESQELPDPCVIVLDLRLPKHDGLNVLKEIRRTPALTHIQVVVLSTSVLRAELEQIQAYGAHFREKPVDLDGFDALGAFIADLCRNGVASIA